MNAYQTIKEHLRAHGFKYVTMYFRGRPTCMVLSSYYDNALNRKVNRVHKIATKQDLLNWLT